MNKIHVVRLPTGRYSHEQDAVAWKRAVVQVQLVDEETGRYIHALGNRKPEVVKEWPKRHAKDRAKGAWSEKLDRDIAEAHAHAAKLNGHMDTAGRA